jgi:hypothetical protein
LLKNIQTGRAIGLAAVLGFVKLQTHLINMKIPFVISNLRIFMAKETQNQVFCSDLVLGASA